MATAGYMTGMQGVYLVAAELTALGFIVSPTLRNAAGADLLVTDPTCQKAWTVQVKTNKKAASFWLLSANAAQMKSESHVYVFVNIGNGLGPEYPEYVVVPSAQVAEKIKIKPARPGTIWYEFWKADRLYKEGPGWREVFGPIKQPG